MDKSERNRQTKGKEGLSVDRLDAGATGLLSGSQLFAYPSSSKPHKPCRKEGIVRSHAFSTNRKNSKTKIHPLS